MHSKFGLLFIFIAFNALAADSDIHELFRKVWSPYCKGVSLQECSSSQAQELRDELVNRVNQGETPEQILSDLETKYGDRLRMMPDRGGRENLAWQLPWIFAFAVILGILFFSWKRRRKISPKPSMPQESTLVDPQLQNKILNDLNDRI